MFSEVRVAQMAAYLINKSGGTMKYLKLMKLLYLADRESLDRYGDPISGDHMVSMKHGPVLSQTYDLIKAGGDNPAEGWEAWIAGQPNYAVASTRPLATRDDFDELSDADLEILNKIWGQFGHMNQYHLVDYTHDNCSEWVDPCGSSFPIAPEAVFLALGKQPETAVTLANRLREQQQLDALVHALK